jgi:hypothetical protein
MEAEVMTCESIVQHSKQSDKCWHKQFHISCSTQQCGWICMVLHDHEVNMAVIPWCGQIRRYSTSLPVCMILFYPLVPHMHHCHISMLCTSKKPASQRTAILLVWTHSCANIAPFYVDEAYLHYVSHFQFGSTALT